MKKLVALVLVLMLGLSLVSFAIAAERYGSDTTTPNAVVIDGKTHAITDNGVVNGSVLHPWGTALFAIGANNKISARLPYADLPLYGEPIKKHQTSFELTPDGQIIRYKKWVEGSLNQDGFFDKGATELKVAFLPTKPEYVGKTAAEVVDGTALGCTSNRWITHRAVEEANETDRVGYLIFPDGKYVNVYLVRWEGALKLVFDAGLATSGSGSTPTKTPDNTTVPPTTPTPTGGNKTDFTIGGEACTQAPTQAPTKPSTGWSDELTGGSSNPTQAPTQAPTNKPSTGWSDEFSSNSNKNTGFTIDGGEAGAPTPTPTPAAGWTI